MFSIYYMQEVAAHICAMKDELWSSSMAYCPSCIADGGRSNCYVSRLLPIVIHSTWVWVRVLCLYCAGDLALFRSFANQAWLTPRSALLLTVDLAVVHAKRDVEWFTCLLAMS